MSKVARLLAHGPDDLENAADIHVGTLVEHCAGTLYRTALRLTGRREDAEDLVQETFARAWRSRATFRPDGNGRAWLFAIMMNVRAELFRRARHTPPVVYGGVIDGADPPPHAPETSIPVFAESPEEATMNAVLSGEVEAVLRRIPEPFLAAFVLADLEHLSYQEIGQILGVPLGTVRSRIARARGLLRQALWDYCVRTGMCRVPPAPAAAAVWLPECVEACKQISTALGQRGAAALAQVESHLAVCRLCCDLVAFHQRLWETVRSHHAEAHVPDATRRLVDRVVATFRRAIRRQPGDRRSVHARPGMDGGPDVETFPPATHV
jgi:RNA polymerase sigma-70 factor (ECF subfamily)